jgi:hypothetical protein
MPWPGWRERSRHERPVPPAFFDMKHQSRPCDESYWGPEGIDLDRWKMGECSRGARYKDTGAPVASGTKAQVHKISTGRKHRGMASDGVK